MEIQHGMPQPAMAGGCTCPVPALVDGVSMDHSQHEMATETCEFCIKQYDWDSLFADILTSQKFLSPAPSDFTQSQESTITFMGKPANEADNRVIGIRSHAEGDSRYRALNRAAQRRYRERRKEYTRELESQIEDIRNEYESLSHMYRQKIDEICFLKNQIQQLSMQLHQFQQITGHPGGFVACLGSESNHDMAYMGSRSYPAHEPVQERSRYRTEF